MPKGSASYWCHIWLNAHFIGFWLLISASGNGKGFRLPQRLTWCNSSRHTSTASLKKRPYEKNENSGNNSVFYRGSMYELISWFVFLSNVSMCEWDCLTLWNHQMEWGEKCSEFVRPWHFILFNLLKNKDKYTGFFLSQSFFIYSKEEDDLATRLQVGNLSSLLPLLVYWPFWCF